jgi:predicted dehydrogenase
MSKKKINVGIVGLGYAKQVLIPALEQTGLYNIVGLSDSKKSYQTVTAMSNPSCKNYTAVELCNR